MKIKELFERIDKKTKIMYYIYLSVSLFILILSYIYNYILKEGETSVLLAELSVIILAIGVWGSVFCEIYKKKINY